MSDDDKVEIVAVYEASSSGDDVKWNLCKPTGVNFE
jgi:hypothetical protein